ncbi:hypothetical protein JCM10207_008675 [Rhodosporidiobolus poonsookiae]
MLMLNEHMFDTHKKYPASHRRVLVLPDGSLVKTGKGVTVKVFYEYDGHGHLFMEHFEGVQLDQAWPQLTSELQDSLLSSIAIIPKTLSAVTASHIGTVSGLSASCTGWLASIPSPHTSSTAFVSAVGTACERAVARFGFLPPPSGNTERLIARLRDDPHIRTESRFPFQHCDLAPRNLLVDPQTGKLVAVLDWECAAFAPLGLEYAAFLSEECLPPVPGVKELCAALKGAATGEEARPGEEYAKMIDDLDFTERAWMKY